MGLAQESGTGDVASTVQGPLQLLPLLSPSRYYITRAKLVSKIAKYPHVVSKGLGVRGWKWEEREAVSGQERPVNVWLRELASSLPSFQEDYRRTVTEIDEKEYISLRLIISELRNQYVSDLGPCPQSPWLLVLVILFLLCSGGQDGGWSMIK